MFSTRTPNRKISNPLISMLFLLIVVGALQSETFGTTVTNTNDSGPGSLRQAIADATPGSTINFDPSVFATPQTITLTAGQLVVDKNLTIQGPGANLLSISGNKTSRVFYINTGFMATLDGVTISNGNPSGNPFTNGDGGGIFNNGSLTLSKSTVRGNTSDSGNSESRGGGIYTTGALSLHNSTITGNYAWDGGGIFNNGTMTVSNSTISGNSSANTGGGIFNEGTMTGRNSTIYGNLMGTNSHGLYSEAGTETLINTIVAGNLSDGNFNLDIGGTIETVSHNLIGSAASSGGIVNGVNGNVVGVDPLIGPLADNGGPTRTHALLPGSLAINAGNNCVLTENGCGDGNLALPFDQRGFSRSGTVDIGAFELQYVTAGPHELSGRVVTSSQRGISGAYITLDGGKGNSQFAFTSTFGYFSFLNVPTGTYTIRVRSKRDSFSTSTIPVTDSVTGLSLVALHEPVL